jgi:molecular chaperone Hsp33
MEKTLISIGEGDLQEIIDDGKGAELCCHFCNNKFFFSTDDIIRLLAEAKAEKEEDEDADNE